MRGPAQLEQPYESGEFEEGGALQQLIAPAGTQGRGAGFNQAALLPTVPVGALGGEAPALGNTPVRWAAAAAALASGATLWAPIRTRGLPLPDQVQ